jgi:hypothetical protein
MVYEHGKPWWNDVDREKILIRPPEVSGNPTSSHLVESRKNGRKEWVFGLEKNLFHTCDFFPVVKSYDMGPTALFPHRRRVCSGFLSPIKIITSAGLEPANVG